MSKKALLGGAVVVAGVFAVSPYFTGSALETNLNEQIAALNAQPAYKAEVVKFDKGYFTSSGVIHVTLDLGTMADDTNDLPERVEFDLNFDAQHGLLLTQYNPGIGLAAWKLSFSGDDLRKFVKWNDDEAIYQMTGSIGLFGDAEYRDWAPELTSVENKEGIAFNFSGYQGQGSVGQDQVAYSGGFKDMTVSIDDKARFKMSKMNLELNAQTSLAALLAGTVYQGTSSFTIDEVSFEDVEMTQPLVLKGYELTSRSDINEDQDTTSIVVNQLLKSFESSALNANDIHFDMSMDNLDIGVLEAFQQFAAKQDTATDPAILFEQQTAFFLDQLPKIIDDNPNFKIDKLSASLEQGDVNADMVMQLADVDQLPDPIDDQVFWLTHINSEANVSIEKPLALWLAQQQILVQLRSQLPPAQQDPVQMQQIAEQQAPLVISTFVQQGFLTEQDNAYVSNFTMQDGEFVLNGNELPILQALQQQ